MTQDFTESVSAGNAPSTERRLAHKVYAGMWGKPEIIAVAIGGLALLVTLTVFVIFVMPARKALASARSEQSKLEEQVTSAREKYGKITTTEEQVARLVQSATNFETAYLPIDSVGQTALYQRLNTLIGTYNLINTSGPEYTPLDMMQGGAQPKDSGERGREKYRSIFPGVYVTMTVEGTYADIRKFISDIETSEQFVIISAVGLEPSDQGRRTGGDEAGTPGAAPRRTARGGVVSLKIELAAYFRRQSVQQQ